MILYGCIRKYATRVLVSIETPTPTPHLEGYSELGAKERPRRFIIGLNHEYVEKRRGQSVCLQ